MAAQALNFAVTLVTAMLLLQAVTLPGWVRRLGRTGENRLTERP